MAIIRTKLTKTFTFSLLIALLGFSAISIAFAADNERTEAPPDDNTITDGEQVLYASEDEVIANLVIAEP